MHKKAIVFCVSIAFFIFIIILITIYNANNEKKIAYYDISNYREFHIEITTDKEIYYLSEPVLITVKGYLGGDKSYVQQKGCRLTIQELNITESDPFDLWSGIVFEAPSEMLLDCINYSEMYNFSVLINQTYLWNQTSCNLKNLPIEANPGEYKIRFNCGFSDLRGTLMEGIYHSAISDSVNIRIVDS
jgi:hypothetical protein